MKGTALEPRKAGLFYHVPVAEGEVPEVVLLPGAPERVDRIASFMDSVSVRRQNREFRVAIGRYRGARVAAVSTGIGGPSTSIAVEELARAGARAFIRVGTCGAIQPDVRVGDVVVCAAAVRYDGASHDYAPPEYPAAAGLRATMALVEAAERLGVRYHVGVVASTSTFYTGQSRPGFAGYSWPGTEDRLRVLQRMNVVCFEMEAATLFTIGLVYGLETGCVCAAVANRVTDTMVPDAGVDDAIRVALEAARLLARMGLGGKPVPSLVARAAEEIGLGEAKGKADAGEQGAGGRG